MFAAAQAQPDQLAIIDHEMRFHPTRLQLRQMIRDGEIGHLLRVDCSRVSGDRLNPDLPWTWWADASKGGGMLGAIGSHLIDLSRWLAGRIESLTGQTQIAHYTRRDSTGQPHPVTADDHADILLHFGNGVCGRIVVSGITPGATSGMEIVVTGEKGALRINSLDQLEARGNADSNGVWEAIAPATPAVDLGEVATRGTMSVGSYYLAQAIATALPLGETSLPEAASFYDGLVVQRALDAIYSTRKSLTWVSL
jgi:predicted dehydrogenase